MARVRALLAAYRQAPEAERDVHSVAYVALHDEYVEARRAVAECPECAAVIAETP